MKFSYSKKIYANLVIGIMCIGWGMYSYFFSESSRDYFPIFFGSLFIGVFINKYVYKYVEITDQEIKVNSFPAKILAIDQINFIGNFGDDYILRSTNKSIRISKSRMNQSDLPRFETFISKLEINLKDQLFSAHG